ncbi:MAG: 3-dehydroquinate synthase [Acidobacteria bacterium]|nr:3-dehydroquinate synthase [Acidobacteriota bacterium]
MCTFECGGSHVEIGSGIWADRLSRSVQGSSKLFVVSQQPVWRIYSGLVKQALSSATFVTLVLEDGESVKDLRQFGAMHDWLASHGADRSSLIVVIGGGVAGDLAGFVAATYMRGIRWLYVPTTLLSQQDASVGGKTAVNLSSGKNLVGCFWPPEHVVIDTDFLKSLPYRQQVAGYMEWLKHGVLDGEELLQEILGVSLPTGDWSGHRQELARGVQVKAEIVTRDPREKGDRQLLNLGHTLAHALETTTRYALLHGEAVGHGLIMAVGLGLVRGSQYDWRELTEKIVNLLPDNSEWPSDEQLIEVMQRDKKRRSGKITWVVPSKPGEVALMSDVGDHEVRRALMFWRDQVTQ